MKNTCALIPLRNYAKIGLFDVDQKLIIVLFGWSNLHRHMDKVIDEPHII